MLIPPLVSTAFAWIALLLLYVAVPLIVAAVIFRSGFRQRYLGGFPMLRALFYTLGVALIGMAADWVSDDPEPAPIWALLSAAGIIFVVGSGIWLTGFFVGRWRASRLDSIIRR